MQELIDLTVAYATLLDRHSDADPSAVPTSGRPARNKQLDDKPSDTGRGYAFHPATHNVAVCGYCYLTIGPTWAIAGHVWGKLD